MADGGEGLAETYPASFVRIEEGCAVVRRQAADIMQLFRGDDDEDATTGVVPRADILVHRVNS
jgi:hypothetical protein